MDDSHTVTDTHASKLVCVIPTATAATCEHVSPEPMDDSYTATNTNVSKSVCIERTVTRENGNSLVPLDDSHTCTHPDASESMCAAPEDESNVEYSSDEDEPN